MRLKVRQSLSTFSALGSAPRISSERPWALIFPLLIFLSTAAELILNDDVDGAEEGLSGRNSSFHLVRSDFLFIRFLITPGPAAWGLTDMASLCRLEGLW